MFCKKCGKEIRENMKFCPQCGNPVNAIETKEHGNPKARAGKKNKRLFAIIAGAVIIVAVGGGVFVALKDQKVKKQYSVCVDVGNKYLEEMEYEKAEASYLKAIKINPKEKESYMKLADIYMAQGEQDKATEILKQAIENIDEKDSEDVVERYNLYSYVDKVLIPQIGRVEEGTYECNYGNLGTGFELYPVSTEKGVMNWYIADYDGDGTEELLVLILDKQKETSEGNSIPRNRILLQMYASEKDKVTLQDKYEGLSPVLGTGDLEDDGIFLKRKENVIYICGSNYGLVSNYADGATVKSFIISYKDGKFVQEAGLDQATASSTPEDYVEIVDKMCELTERLGLSNETEQLRSSGWPRFLFTDEVDKTLLRIDGYNEGFNSTMFYQTSQVEYLGKVVLEVKYGELHFESVEKETETNDLNESTEENQDDTISNQEGDIVGNWTIDAEATNVNNENSLRTEFGSGISSGDDITFNEDGSFSWYVGIGNGGEGTYVNENGTISGTYTSYEDGSQRNIDMIISGDEIIMNIWGDDSYHVYWKKR
mgnify:CR=1 FL=1